MVKDTRLNYRQVMYEYQKKQIEGYLNRKRTNREIISQQVYQTYKNDIFRSTETTFNIVDWDGPIFLFNKLSSYMLSEFCLRVGLNIEFLYKAFDQAGKLLTYLNEKYDYLLSQVRDNYVKVANVKMALLNTPVMCSLPLPYVLMRVGGGNTYLAQMKVRSRTGKGVDVSKLSPFAPLPLVITSVSDSVLRNTTNDFTVTIDPMSNLYDIQIKVVNFDGHESLFYFIQIEKTEEGLRYRCSADGSYFGDWYDMVDSSRFHQMYNDYGEPNGLEFRLMPKTQQFSFNNDWFLKRAEHIIELNRSTDYGMVKDITLVLSKPTVPTQMTISNFDSEPFIIERIEGSLDDTSYMDISSGRTTVYDVSRVSLFSPVPVKYIKLYLKQESYRVQYEREFDLNDFIYTVNMSYQNKNIVDFIRSKVYDVVPYISSNPTVVDKFKQFWVNRSTINDVVRQYKYTITLDSIFINGRNLIDHIIY